MPKNIESVINEAIAQDPIALIRILAEQLEAKNRLDLSDDLFDIVYANTPFAVEEKETAIAS